MPVYRLFLALFVKDKLYIIQNNDDCGSPYSDKSTIFHNK